LIVQVIQLGIYLVVLFWLNSSITVMTMGLILLFGAPFVLFQRLSYRLGQGNTDTVNEASFREQVKKHWIRLVW